MFLNKEVQIIPQPPPPLQRMYPFRRKKEGFKNDFVGNECSNLPCGAYRRALVLIRLAVGIPSSCNLNVMEALNSRLSEVTPPARMLPKENTFPEVDGAKLSICFLFSPEGPITRSKALIVCSLLDKFPLDLFIPSLRHCPRMAAECEENVTEFSVTEGSL